MASTFGPEMLIQLLRNIFKKKMYLKADMTKVAVHFSLKNCSFIMCVHNFLFKKKKKKGTNIKPIKGLYWIIDLCRNMEMRESSQYFTQTADIMLTSV